LTYRFGDPTRPQIQEIHRAIKDIDRPAPPREPQPEKKQQKKEGPALLVPGWE